MGHRTGQVAAIIPGKAVIDESPCRLPLYSPLVAGDANDVIVLQRRDDTVNKEIVVDPHVIVHEDETLIGVVGANPFVVNRRQSAPVGERHVEADAVINRKPA